jgi:hypothetical protein
MLLFLNHRDRLWISIGTKKGIVIVQDLFLSARKADLKKGFQHLVVLVVVVLVARCDFVAYGQGMQKTFQRFFM